MWHEAFIIDKLIPQYDWGDEPPNCRSRDLNVSTMPVFENHQTSVVTGNSKKIIFHHIIIYRTFLLTS
jgi:hypothetical protein